MARRNPAELFCLIGGAVLLGRGVFGFALLDAEFSTPGEGWHHTIHLVTGAALLGALWAGEGAARAAAIAFGIGYTGLAVAGLVEGDTAFGLIGADAADKAFHAVIGVTSLVAGAVSRPKRAITASARGREIPLQR